MRLSSSSSRDMKQARLPLLSLHPEQEARLHAELDAVLGGRVPTFDDLEKLSYTRMVIEEAMRLYPPAPALTGRVAREPDDICGRPVRKGEEIAILPWVLHRHRTLWDDCGGREVTRVPTAKVVDRRPK
jgi:cytochrome P450